MNPLGFLAVGLGAALGAWLRWGLSLAMNHWFAPIPLGTLAANLIGGYFIGVAISLFHLQTSLPPELRLFVITGLLGGLTTFSTFSAEVIGLISRTQYLLALGAVALHLFGSLLCTGLGIYSVQLLRS
jgi:CrcB protein